ncbi:MAG TPA: hypothetical protein VKV96_08300 [Roseiarcus sp.]|nr:hypothetical protein [Roseiarcus sp.]
MKTQFSFRWDVLALAQAFKVEASDIEECLTDGRRASFFIERRLKWEHHGWTLAKSEGAGYDLLDPDGGLWEVRSITAGGVYFNPSNQVGSGRRFSELGFQEKLGLIKGFILADIVDFPEVRIFVVPALLVREWHAKRRLGVNARVSRATFYARFTSELPV